MKPMFRSSTLDDSKYDKIFIFICFLGGALASYILLNHAALLGI
ncbi:MAG: hypothetical protein ACQCN4_01095 [Candidatus Bathyarchaeia archaeon]